jgi:hypothetical protein
VECTIQDDDFREVNRRKRHIYNDTSERAKKSNKPVSKSTTMKRPPKAILTRNFFAPLRTTDMDRETTVAKKRTTGAGWYQKTGRPPPRVTSTTKLTRLLSDLKDHIKGEHEFRNSLNGSLTITKEMTNNHP